MEFECKICNKKFNSKESLEQHIKAKHQEKEEKKPKNTKKYLLFGIFLVAIILFAVTFYVKSLSPGKYDDFAKCLGEKAVIYGNDFCDYTNQQRNLFGKSQKHLNYVKCIENEELCNSKQVKITPTWEINGTNYEGVQGFEKLAALSGCEI